MGSMEQDTSLSLLTFESTRNNDIEDFARRHYGTRFIFETTSLFAYHAKLAEYTYKLASYYFDTLDGRMDGAYASQRIVALTHAAWLLSAIYRGHATRDDIMHAAENSEVATLVAFCTPDARMFSPRRVEQMLRKMPTMSIDAKILLLAHSCLSAKLRKKRSDFYEWADLYKVINALDEPAANAFLAEERSKALKICRSFLSDEPNTYLSPTLVQKGAGKQSAVKGDTTSVGPSCGTDGQGSTEGPTPGSGTVERIDGGAAAECATGATDVSV